MLFQKQWHSVEKLSFPTGNCAFSTVIEKNLIKSTGSKNNQRGHPYDSDKDLQKPKIVKIFFSQIELFPRFL